MCKRIPSSDMPNFRKNNTIFDVFLEQRISGGEMYHLGDNGSKKTGNRVIPVPLLLLLKEGYISSLLFHCSDNNGNGLSCFYGDFVFNPCLTFWLMSVYVNCHFKRIYSYRRILDECIFKSGSILIIETGNIGVDIFGINI